MRKKKLWIAVLVGIFAAIALLLLVDRMAPKDFADLCPNPQKLEACQIVCAAADGSNSINLTGAELEEPVLEGVSCFKEGSYGAVMEGNVCHLFLSSQGKEVFAMHASDAGKVYTKSSCCDFAPGVSPTALSSNLQTLF